MPVGPQLPPHLQGKRKHDDSGGDSDSSDEGSMGPAPPSEKRRKVEDEPSEAKLAPEPAPKSGPRIGPTPPPGPLDQRPLSRQDDDSESDDDYGPAPPPVQVAENAPVKSIFDQESTGETRKPEEKRRRDDWMMLPPQQDDLAARLDPTKLKARGFNTGKSAKQGGGKGGISSIWTETPEERRQRLQDQVMGVKVDESGSKATAKDHRKEQENEEKARKIREHNERFRSQSLLEQHKKASKKEVEDDPSQRAFDYEKDIAAGTKMGHAQRRQMLNKAGDFSSKFSKGSYL